MRILEAALGVTLAWSGLFAESSGDGAAWQAVLCVLGVLGGIWLMAKAIFSRQETRIAFLEAQNVLQQKAIDEAREQHGECAVKLARFEERFANLQAKVEQAPRPPEAAR